MIRRLALPGVVLPWVAWAQIPVPLGGNAEEAFGGAAIGTASDKDALTKERKRLQEQQRDLGLRAQDERTWQDRQTTLAEKREALLDQRAEDRLPHPQWQGRGGVCQRHRNHGVFV